MGRFIQRLAGEIPEFVPVSKPNLPPNPVIKKVEVTDSDPIEDMCRQLEDLHINQTKIEKAIKKNSSKPKSSRRKTKSKLKSSNSSDSEKNSSKPKFSHLKT